MRPPFRVLYPAGFLFFLLFVFLVAAGHSSRAPRLSPREEGVVKDAYADIAVVHVYDGDTIKLSNGEHVRILGIDTPESRKNKRLFRSAARSGQDVKDILSMGHLAAEYTKELLQGRRVRLEFDIEKRDKYGRLLAYVYRLDDGLFVNREIIKNGYAYPLTIPPNGRYTDEFKELFREARQEKRGLWADSLADRHKNK